jgi:hypothetical protein
VIDGRCPVIFARSSAASLSVSRSTCALTDMFTTTFESRGMSIAEGNLPVAFRAFTTSF